MSARPGEERKPEGTTSRVRGASASKDGAEMKFGGRGRQSSGTRETEVRGVRGTSANKGADVKFGGRDRSTGSRDRQALQFGKASGAGGEGVKLDPDSMIIKKKDHELLKE